LKKRGFTLAETVYASVLFAFVILFVLNIYPSSMVAIRRGETQIIADNCAQSILEDLRSRSFTNIKVGAPPSYEKWVYHDTTFHPYLEIFYDTDDERFLKIARLDVAWVFQNRENHVIHTMYVHNVTR
jgi:Tfp pilus assembly protein PilV